MVRRAYEIATERHHTSSAAPATPISPSSRVAHILADMRLDATALTAAILHDAIEDTDIPSRASRKRFALKSPISSKG